MHRRAGLGRRNRKPAADAEAGDAADDAAAPIAPAEVTFEGVRSVIAGKKGAAETVVLAGVSGSARPGRLLAVRPGAP